MIGVRAVLVTHTDTDPNTIYTITQILHEFSTDLVSEYPRAATIILPEAGENLGLPLHPGAKFFYNEDQPSFLEQYAEPMGFLLSVIVVSISGAWQLHRWWIGQQKNRADMYNLQILDLVNQIEECPDPSNLISLRHQLFEILRQVVVDLDQDQLTAESFQSFTLPWEVAFSTLRHRETFLLHSSPYPIKSPILSPLHEDHDPSNP